MKRNKEDNNFILTTNTEIKRFIKNKISIIASYIKNIINRCVTSYKVNVGKYFYLHYKKHNKNILHRQQENLSISDYIDNYNWAKLDYDTAEFKKSLLCYMITWLLIVTSLLSTISIYVCRAIPKVVDIIEKKIYLSSIYESLPDKKYLVKYEEINMKLLFVTVENNREKTILEDSQLNLLSGNAKYITEFFNKNNLTNLEVENIIYKNNIVLITIIEHDSHNKYEYKKTDFDKDYYKYLGKDIINIIKPIFLDIYNPQIYSIVVQYYYNNVGLKNCFFTYSYKSWR